MAGKGDKNRTRNFTAYRDSPLWEDRKCISCEQPIGVGACCDDCREGTHMLQQKVNGKWEDHIEYRPSKRGVIKNDPHGRDLRIVFRKK
jgi:hypothetical protein